MTSKTNPVCRKCGVELTIDNWAPSNQKSHHHICKSCDNKRYRQWRRANPEKARAKGTRHSRKEGHQPMGENKECPAYLGVHIAEEVLSSVFKNVQRMLYGHPGFDFICNGGYEIDVKSSCSHKDGSWIFHINHNTIADYFLCLAFDNREDLNPLHVWLIPGEKINHLKGTSISPSTIHKWDEYRLDISKVKMCCDTMR